MPSLGMITINTLAAADSVIIPVQAHYLPAKGMTQLVNTVNQVKRQINPNLSLDGVLLTIADMRTNLARETADTLRATYGGYIKIFDTIIPSGIRAADTAAYGQSIYAYDGEGKVAKAYEAFTKEVLDHGKKQVKTGPTISR